MAKQPQTFEEMLQGLTEKLGDPFKTDFNKDRASFNLISSTGMTTAFSLSTKAMQNSFDTPVGGARRFKPGPDDEQQYSDQNTQIKTKPSSTIQAAAYWKDKEYLIVSFKSGHSYSYSGVPVRVVQAWEQASSAGSFFYYNIRTSYSYMKMG